MTLTWAGGKAEFGKQVTINITRDSQSYRHQLLIYFDDLLQTTLYGVTNMAVYTPSLDLMRQIPANTQGTFKVVCYTFDGSGELTNPGRLIGQQTSSVTLYVPDTVVPTISKVALSDPTGYLGKYGAYVLGKSHIQAEITAAGAYGSTIASYKVSIGTAYDVSSSFNFVTIADINIAGDIKVTSTATDTRNRSAQSTQNVKVASYAAPDLSQSSVARWDTSTGKEDDESSNVRIRAKGSIYDVNSKGINAGTVKIETAAYGSDSWTTRDTRTVGSGAFDYSIYVSGMDTNQRYQARITATDSFGVTSETVITIETAQPVLDFRANGKGLALFGVSNKDGLQVYGDEEVTGSATVGGAVSAGGMGSFGGGVSLGNGVLLSKKYSGSQSADVRRTVLLAKSQRITSDNGNFGFVHIYGSIGTWQASQNGTVDFRVPFRELTGASQLDVTAYSRKIDDNMYRFIVTKDASGYIYVYLVITGQSYWTVSLTMDGEQCDFFWREATGHTDEWPGVTGSMLIESISFVPDLYPVGTVLIRYDHTSPAELFGGTWARIEGRFLYATGASGTIGATGGSGTHTLTTAQIPSHTHGIYMKKSSTEGSQYGLSIASAFAGRVYITGDSTNTYATGSGQAHNNNPAFINVSVWRRTA